MRRIVFVLSLFIVLGSVDAYAQKVRLRSRITPDCGVTSLLKFADIWADGNIAVMGTYNCRGAFIFDVSNPDAPTLSNWYNPSPNQSFLEAIVIGNRGYFGSGGQGPGSPSTGDGVHIVDLTNPQSPVLLGKVNSASGNGFNGIHEMVIFEQGGQRFLIENYNALSNKIIKVINITNPAAPVFVRDITPTEISWVHAFHIRGNKLYTSGWGTTFAKGRTEIYDISNIATQPPSLLGYIEDANASVMNGNSMHSSWTSEDGNYLYSAREVSASNGASPGDVRVYDVSDPATPLLVNRVTMADLGLNAITPHNPVVMGNKLYVSWYQAGLQLFDISTPGSLRHLGQYDTYGPAFVRPAATETTLADEPWDVICGSESLQNSLPTTYNGAWAVFPFLGTDKVLVGDMNDGLLVMDTTKATAPRKNVVSDFDGDGKTDLSRYTPSTGDWNIENSSTNQLQGQNWGISEDVLTPADYDGDGKTDVAIWRPSSGDWWISPSSGGSQYSVNWGISGDIPVAGDFDADGRADIAVWRPSSGDWWVWRSTLGIRKDNWGISTDRPITGDWDGDGKTDLGIFRPTEGNWYIMPSSSSIPMIQNWGIGSDRPVSGDFTGDGKTDFVIYRPSGGDWWILDRAEQKYFVVNWGIAQDIAVPGDYDGDEIADIAVYRPSDRLWYRINSTDSTYSVFAFGDPGDRPSPASVNPY